MTSMHANCFQNTLRTATPIVTSKKQLAKPSRVGISTTKQNLEKKERRFKASEKENALKGMLSHSPIHINMPTKLNKSRSRNGNIQPTGSKSIENSKKNSLANTHAVIPTMNLNNIGRSAYSRKSSSSRNNAVDMRFKVHDTNTYLENSSTYSYREMPFNQTLKISTAKVTRKSKDK